MKKLYTLIAVAITSFGFAQNVEILNNPGVITGDFSSWTFTNNITTQNINQTPSAGSYLLVEPGEPGDIITTTSYNTSIYTNLKLNMQVATYGSGTNNPAKIEVSYDNGTTFSQEFTTATPSSSTYIASGEMILNSSSSNLVIRITNNSTSGKGVRIKNIILTGEESTTPEPVEPTATFASESLTGFTYIEAQGPSTTQSVVLTVADLTAENTLSVVSTNGNFEIVNPTALVNGANTIEIRLASGLDAGEYTGSVQVTLGDEILDTITLTGEVTDAPLSNVSNDIEGLRIFPNPANDVVTISTNSSAVKSVQMFDISGKQVLNVETSSTINVSSLSKGIYVVKIVEEGKTSTSKLVIK